MNARDDPLDVGSSCGFPLKNAGHGTVILKNDEFLVLLFLLFCQTTGGTAVLDRISGSNKNRLRCYPNSLKASAFLP